LAHINRLRKEREKAENDMKRQEIDKEIRGLQSYVRGSQAADNPPSDLKKARERIRQGFRRLKTTVSNMPRFAEHLGAAISYDAIRDSFVYDAGGIDWKIVTTS
jgi:hypothetical protein